MANYTATYEGLTLGPDTDYDLISVEGWLDRDVQISTPDLPRYHGGLIGDSYHSPRRVILTIDVSGTTMANRRALLTAFQPQVDSESPFVLTLPGETAHRIDCRPQRAASRIDIFSELGLARFVIELIASDPAIYDDTLSTVNFGVFAPSAGLSYPVTYPKAYGA